MTTQLIRPRLSLTGGGACGPLLALPSEFSALSKPFSALGCCFFKFFRSLLMPWGYRSSLIAVGEQKIVGRSRVPGNSLGRTLTSLISFQPRCRVRVVQRQQTVPPRSGHQSDGTAQKGRVPRSLCEPQSACRCEGLSTGNRSSR